MQFRHVAKLSGNSSEDTDRVFRGLRERLSDLGIMIIIIVAINVVGGSFGRLVGDFEGLRILSFASRTNSSLVENTEGGFNFCFVFLKSYKVF